MITNIEILKKDLPFIQNIKSFLVQIPKLHPDNPRYTALWTQYTKWCIEGFWAFDNGGWRFMPPTLFFYGNFFKIKDTDRNKKERRFIKPKIRDLNWHIHYAYLEAQGFSGFKNDDLYSADYALIDINLYKEIEVSHEPSDKVRFNDLHSSNGKRKTYITPKELIRKLHRDNLGKPLYYNNAQNIILFGCLGENTKVRMYDGSQKNVQDIKVGDLLIGPDSTSREVNNLIQGDSFLYRIKSKYSNEFFATDTHILRLRRIINTRRKGKAFIKRDELNISVGEYLNLLRNKPINEKYELVSSGIEYNEQSLKWNPYLLGLWLGDGFKGSRMICMSKSDHETLNWLKNHFKEKGFDYRIKESLSGFSTEPVYRINWLDPENSKKGNWFAKTIANNKHIPNEYLINSKENRLTLLAGMIDSDGNYEKDASRFTITNTNLDLLNQFKELAKSLGFNAIIHGPNFTGVTNSAKYSLRITGDITEIPTQLLRKRAIRNSKSTHINSFTVEFEKIDKFYGLEINKDHLFIIEDYIVTHNSRGGGKSFEVSGITSQILTFDGIKEFSKEAFLKPPTAEVTIGAAITDKSSELIKKVTDGLYFMGTDPELGVWGNSKDADFEPNPFYRSWVGDAKPGNKKNPFRYEYDVQTQNGWTKEGTKTALYHVNYSDKKQDGDQAGAGARNILCVYEEVGLMPNFIDALMSNIGTVSVDGIQFGVQWALGTSGNIELVQQSKKVFNNPRDYNFLGFDNIWEDDEHARVIGLFLPAYLADARFKDENGNTDIERALKFYMDRRLDAMSKKDPSAIYNEKMNYPIVPSDMWISNKGSYFPQMELTEQEKWLLKENKYRTIGRSAKLTWHSESQNGVKIETDEENEPFYDFPFNRSMTSITGCPRIFHEPEYLKGKIPDDMYMFVLDPYVSDNIDEGGSVGAFYGFLNPKYWKEGIKQTLVCSYIGKPIDGKDAFYSNCEKLIQYYGNCPRSFMYEANRGDSVKGYFLKKNKLHLLALEPTKEKGSNIYAKRVQNYGLRVNSRTDKIEMIDDTSEWLLSECYDGKRVIETIPCIFFIRQAIQFDVQGNFDAVSAFIIFPAFLKEVQHNIEDEIKKKGKHNPLAGLSMNPNIFKINELDRIKQKYEQIKQQYS